MLLYKKDISHIYQIPEHGRYFYPVLHPGRFSGRHIIITYLTEEMVWGNMMGEVQFALSRHKPREDAWLDFDEDPEHLEEQNNGGYLGKNGAPLPEYHPRMRAVRF